MAVVFINYPAETFTPTESGAIATIIWECCQASARRSFLPWVITRTSKADMFPWARVATLPFPEAPENRLLLKIVRLHRKLFGWRFPLHQVYARRTLAAIRQAGVENLPMVLFNDPETAVFLRDRLPGAGIYHWFQNQLPAGRSIRCRFSGAVNGAMGVSAFTARANEREFGCAPDTVKTLYNGVNLQDFKPGNQGCAEVVTINFVGRTGIEKAPDLLLKAALKVADKTTNFRVQILGSNHWGRLEHDSYQAELDSLSDHLQKKGVQVHRPGHVSRTALPAELQKADVNVVPSRWDEPFALTILEGMATGLATVVSRTGGAPEVVGDAGLLFEREDVDGLAAHLELLISSPQARLAYGEKARKRAETFSWDRTWAGLQAILGLSEGEDGSIAEKLRG